MPVENKKESSENEFLGLKGFLSFLILHELDSSPLCGDDLSKRIGRRKGTNLTPGTIYPALKRLKRRKLMTFKRQGRKKVYSLTNDGQKEIQHLYLLFGNYFYGLKDRIAKSPIPIGGKAKKDIIKVKKI